MDKLLQLNKKKAQLLSELESINQALAHPEYGSAEPYDFQFKSVLSGNDFTNSIVSEMVEACNYANVNFLPDIVVQMVEEAAFDRFKAIIKKELDGKPIKALMQIKNVLERKMLADQKSGREDKLKEIDFQLDAALDEKVVEYDAPLAVDAEVPVKKATKKK